MKNAIFRKPMENVRKHGDVQLVKTETRRIYLVSEPNYRIKKFFFIKFIIHKNEINSNTH